MRISFGSLRQAGSQPAVSMMRAYGVADLSIAPVTAESYGQNKKLANFPTITDIMAKSKHAISVVSYINANFFG